MEKPIDFLKWIYNTDCDNFAVTYKPYEHSNLVKTIGIDEAVALIEQDIKELRDFMKGVKGIDLNKIEEWSVEGTYKLWEKQLVVF